MATKAEEAELAGKAHSAAEEQAFVERLRAGGVTPASKPLDRPDRVTVKLRPRWLAFLIRTLRLDP